MSPEGKIILAILSIYFIIGLILAFFCRIWYLKTGDAYHLERMNSFAYWLGNEPGLTVVSWPYWLAVAFVDFFVRYLHTKLQVKQN